MKHQSKKGRIRQVIWTLITKARIKCKDGECEAKIVGVCTWFATIGHHIKQRSVGGKDEDENCLVVCYNCHTYIHEHEAWAESVGFLRRSYA